MRKNLTSLLLAAFFTFSLKGQETPVVPKGKVLVEVFGDYYYKINGTASPDSLNSGAEYQKLENERHGMAFRRFNFGYEYTFNDKLSARVLLEGNDGFTNDENARMVYIKFAMVEWNIFGSSSLVIGAQPTPTFSFSDKVWGYRSVEKPIIDFRKDGGSNDVGIGLTGNLNSKGTLHYYLMVGNGSANKIESNNYKRIYGTVYGTLFDKKLAFQLYSDYEGADHDVKRFLLKGFAAYEHKWFALGIEPYNRITSDSSGTVTKSTFGMMVFGRANIIQDKLNTFYRIDFYDNDLKTEKRYKEKFMVFGIDYTPFKNLNIIPNIWINAYHPENANLPDRESDVIARLTFRFKI